MKLVFEGKGGYKLERESAKDKLVVGRKYTVEKIEIGSWNTEVYLQGYKNSFNSCLFERDECLEGLIQCERSKFENLNNELVCKSAEISDLKSKNLYLEDQWLKSKTELCKIKQMGFWKRLVYLFKGKI